MTLDVRDVLRQQDRDPATWDGTYFVHIAGKTGETLYSFGMVPALRELLPCARLVWRVARHYAPVVARVTGPFQPEIQWLEDEHDHDVSNFSERIRQQAVEDQPIGIRMTGNDLHVNLYRTHFWYSRDTETSGKWIPFYLAFCEAAGVPVDMWRVPETIRLRQGDVALAFPTANEHSPRVRELGYGADVWASLAQLARRYGCEPIANGRPGDGNVTLPGWESHDALGIERVLDWISRAQWVVGLNSGIVFAAMLLGPESGGIYMVDPQNLPIYFFAAMPQVCDPARHVQVFQHPRAGWPSAKLIEHADAAYLRMEAPNA
jgi:hypothetical protein